jgi:hypothetical protein
VTELEEALMVRTRREVRITFPDAKLKTNGYMYWVESAAIGGEIISERASTPGRAWRKALDFAAAR